MRKILVLRGGALGDFVVTLPALAALRRRWPASRIELAGNATAAELGRMAGLLDAVHSQHERRWSGLYGEAEPTGDFATWIAEFDLVVNFWPDPDGELARRFPQRPGQRFIFGPAMPACAPAAAHYGEALRELGLAVGEWQFRLASPAEGARTIAIHAGSGSPRKNWPMENWVELCQWLKREHAAELLVVSGDAENDIDPLAPFGRPARSLPLSELVAEFTRCRLFVGHDSGVSHLAAACGVPCVLLFGPTDPAVWAPPAPSVRVLKRGATLAAISLLDVQAAVSAALAART
jgi:heptosyltransferase III